MITCQPNERRRRSKLSNSSDCLAVPLEVRFLLLIYSVTDDDHLLDLDLTAPNLFQEPAKLFLLAI